MYLNLTGSLIRSILTSSAPRRRFSVRSSHLRKGILPGTQVSAQDRLRPKRKRRIFRRSEVGTDNRTPVPLEPLRLEGFARSSSSPAPLTYPALVQVVQCLPVLRFPQAELLFFLAVQFID